MAKTRLPAFLLKYPSLVARGVGDVEMPRLKLLQRSSPELVEGDNAKEGEFWHALARVSVGSPVRICPVYIDSRFILWRPQNAGGGILARADDGKHWAPANAEFIVKLKDGHEVIWRTASTVRASGLHKRGSYDPSDPRSPPAASRVYSIVCAFPDRRDLSPAVVILQRAAMKAATKLIRELKALRAPSFGVVLEMSSFEDKSPFGCFNNYAFRIVEPVESRTVYEDNFAQYRFFVANGLKVRDLAAAQADEALH